MESIQSTMQSNGFPASVTHIQGILCLASLGSCIPLDDVVSGPSQVLVLYASDLPQKVVRRIWDSLQPKLSRRILSLCFAHAHTL